MPCVLTATPAWLLFHVCPPRRHLRLCNRCRLMCWSVTLQTVIALLPVLFAIVSPVIVFALVALQCRQACPTLLCLTCRCCPSRHTSQQQHRRQLPFGCCLSCCPQYENVYQCRGCPFAPSSCRFVTRLTPNLWPVVCNTAIVKRSLPVANSAYSEPR